MKLIMKSEFKLLQDDPNNSYDVDKIGAKETLKIYRGERLIAKRIKYMKSIRYFGVKNYKDFLPEVEALEKQ